MSNKKKDRSQIIRDFDSFAKTHKGISETKISLRMLVRLQSEGLSYNDAIVFIFFIVHADEDGICFPSNERIARLSGLSKRSVQRSIEKLEVGKYLSRDLMPDAWLDGNIARERLRKESERLPMFLKWREDRSQNRPRLTTVYLERNEVFTMGDKADRFGGAICHPQNLGVTKSHGITSRYSNLSPHMPRQIVTLSSDTDSNNDIHYHHYREGDDNNNDNSLREPTFKGGEKGLYAGLNFDEKGNLIIDESKPHIKPEPPIKEGEDFSAPIGQPAKAEENPNEIKNGVCLATLKEIYSRSDEVIPELEQRLESRIKAEAKANHGRLGGIRFSNNPAIMAILISQGGKVRVSRIKKLKQEEEASEVAPWNALQIEIARRSNLPTMGAYQMRLKNLTTEKVYQGANASFAYQIEEKIGPMWQRSLEGYFENAWNELRLAYARYYPDPIDYDIALTLTLQFWSDQNILNSFFAKESFSMERQTKR